MPRKICGKTIGLGLDLWMEHRDEKWKKWVSIDAYAQIFVDIDALIDAGLIQILDYNIKTVECELFINEITATRILDGNKILQILYNRKIIKSGLFKRIKDFKSKRGKVLHSISGIEMLLPKRKSVFYGDNEAEAYYANAKAEANNFIKKGKKIIDELIELSYTEFEKNYSFIQIKEKDYTEG